MDSWVAQRPLKVLFFVRICGSKLVGVNFLKKNKKISIVCVEMAGLKLEMFFAQLLKLALTKTHILLKSNSVGIRTQPS